MKFVKLNAIDSTNNFLKDLVKDTSAENWTVVTTENQTSGKGQFQNKWHSEPGKNLTFSVLCEFKGFKAEQAFYLNCAISLAIFNVLQEYIPEKLYIKWPNDILSHSKKLGGILIENTVNKDFILRSVIGIGLNVNQTRFDDLPNASSVKLMYGHELDKEKLLYKLVEELKKQVALIERKAFDMIKARYQRYLYRINIPAMYQEPSGDQFMGKILGINNQGRLLVELENELIKSFDLKEIRFI